MPREMLTTVTTKLYNENGRHIGDVIDEFFVDRRPGTLHTAQAPQPLRPSTPPVRPGGPLPPSPRPLPKATTPTRPQVECYPCPDVGRLVTERQAGQVPAPLPPPRTAQALVCQRCGCILCRCPVATPGGLDAIVALQRQQGKRP
jgi:hypothetical protein